jgi:hypothetical protein
LTDPKLKLGTRFCKCSACGRYFGGTAGFDMHRQGSWERRFCVDPAALLDKHGRRRLWLNERNLWVSDGPEQVAA